MSVSQTYEVHRIGFTQIVLGDIVNVAKPKMCSMSRFTEYFEGRRANVIRIL
jgi:hypothetical protein